MSRLFESIKIVERIPLHLDYHTARLNRSRRELFGSVDTIDLREALDLPRDLPPTVHKCRVEYATGIERIEFIPYEPRPVTTLALVTCDTVEYPHKFVDRASLNRLLVGISADDILIVKHGLITDSSIANVVFLDGSRWLTPAIPLLPGTARARLLDEGRIAAAEIRADDLGRFTQAALINAMLDLDETRHIPIGAIR
jgi:4-amino-4-deoxychorismate lyase